MASSRFFEYYCVPKEYLVAFDYSRSGLDEEYLARMEPAMQKAYDAMEALEGGAIANPDEDRMVGHYWLRDLERIPDEKLREQVKTDNQRLFGLVNAVKNNDIAPPGGGRFKNLLVIGIGGSALGPQLVADALSQGDKDHLKPFFLDNTDPDGVQRTLRQLAGELHCTICLVISKSGGTPETRNGMLLAEEAYRRVELEFGKHAIAITGEGSKLDQYARENGWIDRLPMYDWVGGRTSIMSAVGLLPAGLQGVDIQSFLAGARDMDQATRTRETRDNPSALLSLFWHFATGGRGEKDMVILPYKDRLLLFSRYLQQLVMESLGKEKDLEGRVVEQGMTVYGNKGSTDQHAYVQQLRDGIDNFFLIFVEVLKDGGNALFEVEPLVTSGDYLSGFYQGTRQALSEKNRLNATITIEEVNAYTLGALIALFERAVGFYASLVNINAYHQPGVEAGKKAAASILDMQKNLIKTLSETPDVSETAEGWASKAQADSETTFKILQHLAHNQRGVEMTGQHPKSATFRWIGTH